MIKVFLVESYNCWLKVVEYYCQRAGIAAGGIFYNVQPGTAAQLKI
jgi:hypothetical protein